MNEKIMVVDDEREIADLVELYLKNEGYKIYKFYTAREALELIGREQLDMAVLDVMLPDGDGFGICMEIRKNIIIP